MIESPDIPQLAILVSTSTGWGRRIIKGILAYVNETGPWHVWLRPETPSNIQDLPKGWRGDGIIARVASPALAEKITASGIPVINVADTLLEGFCAPCVRTDDRAGTHMAADFFVDRGFRNIAYVGSRHSANPIWYGNAFAETLEKKRLPCHQFFINGADPDNNEQLVEWLKRLPKPAGILVWGHGNGRRVLDCCMQVGISVPHDIAVLCGSYDELLSYACFPTLSGILSPTEQIGYTAARMLHQKLQGKEVPNETTYIPPVGIMERLSTDTLAVEDPRMVQVVKFIREHAYESINMDDVLKAVPMARRSLERRFQKIFGRSPLDEIRRLRIDKARSLLAETNLPMQQIAEACGYATYNYLTHVFKQVTDMTPSAYRKKMRIH